MAGSAARLGAGAGIAAARRDQIAFVNQSVYVTDAANYGLRDYWATALEFLVRSGDCEDYAIAKYQSLRLLGWPPEALRLVVVQDVLRDLPHAVLAAYLGDAIYILDNLSDTVLEQAQVENYVPYYSVNEITRWAYLAPGPPGRRQSTRRPAGTTLASGRLRLFLPKIDIR